MSCASSIVGRCRFVFRHHDRLWGLTGSAELADEARALGYNVTEYFRARPSHGGVLEFELALPSPKLLPAIEIEPWQIIPETDINDFEPWEGADGGED